VTVEPPTGPARAGGGVQVIARAAEILRLLRSAPGGLAQAEIAERIGLARTTVHRILGALEDEGLVSPGGSRARYRLGPEIPRLAEAARHTLVVELRPYLEQLSRDLNETVDLSVLERARSMFLDQVVAPRRLRAVSAVGASFPAYTTANGKALLAALDDDTVCALLPERLETFTPGTLSSRSELLDQLREVRRTGLAYDREEQSEGICAVGAVVRGRSWGTAAISVPMPTQRFAGREEEVAAVLRAVVRRIEADFSGDHAPRAGDQALRIGDQTPRAGDQALRTGDQAPRTGDQAPRAGD
jgi:DNA-binding IclR family transcriptional regulator